ncbi:unnamed protein product [Trichobilharzia szidati]|nr:unnamed protein product [Trichobilharzia szidati]
MTESCNNSVKSTVNVLGTDENPIIIEQSTSIDSTSLFISDSLNTDYKDPIRRVRPDAYRKSMQARRCVQHLRKLKSHANIRYSTSVVSTFDNDNNNNDSNNNDNSNDGDSPTSITWYDLDISQYEKSKPSHDKVISYEDYLALPIEIRYPLNYVSDLFEDLHPQSSMDMNNESNREE